MIILLNKTVENAVVAGDGGVPTVEEQNLAQPHV